MVSVTDISDGDRLSRIYWDRMWTPEKTEIHWWCLACPEESRAYTPAEKEVAEADAKAHDETHDGWGQEHANY